MHTKLATVFAAVFCVLGVAGFLSSLTPDGNLFGMFAVDVMHNIVYLGSGLLALAVLWKKLDALLYFKVFGIIFGIFTIVGFLEGDAIFGLMVTNMGDNLLHLIFASLALWAGFGEDAHARTRARA
ncbi:MAG TPA: DUF4383 domain-containing protein [Candidatus Paceibacterota bacterium]|nr:DUF4383 domain-containing protein [Candidatus Paceibacterota bacterium]